MSLEIERKFTINKLKFKDARRLKTAHIFQAYLSTEKEKIIRIRTLDDTGFITIKGKKTGIAQLEYEFPIPAAEAKEIINNFCNSYIEKYRHYIEYKSKLWEVDEFLGDNSGLVVAEIELLSPDEEFLLPPWIEKEVTLEPKYNNAQLFMHPYNTW